MKNIFRSTQQDEWQRTTEGNIAKNSLPFAFVVVVGGGFTMNHHQWASPLWLAMAESGLVGWWYMVQVIWRGVYFTRKAQQNALWLALCGLVSIGASLFQIQFSITDSHWLWRDGHVGSGLGPALSAIYLISLELLGFVRYGLDRRAEKVSEE